MTKKLTMKNPGVSVKVATPIGRLLWLNLARPKSETATIGANKYTCTVAWDKSEDMSALVKAIEDVAKEAYDDPTLKLEDINQAIIKDGASMENQAFVHDMYVCSSSTSAKFPPSVYGPTKSAGPLSVEEIENITQGDYGRMVLTVSAYKTPVAHGITSYLTLVQFAKKGEYIGNNPAVKLIDDLEFSDFLSDI